MRVVDDIPNILSKIKSLHKVPDCPKRSDMPCVFCLECDKSEYDEVEYDDGLMKITANSIILNVRLNVGSTDVDKILLNELIKSLASKYSFILDKPEEGYDISFFFFYTDRDSIKVFEKIIRVIPELGGILTQGRMSVKNWAKSIVNKYFVSE